MQTQIKSIGVMDATGDGGKKFVGVELKRDGKKPVLHGFDPSELRDACVSILGLLADEGDRIAKIAFASVNALADAGYIDKYTRRPGDEPGDDGIPKFSAN